MIISLLRDRRAARLHLHPRRIARGREDPRARASKKRARKISSARTSSAPATIWRFYVHRGAGAYICGEETGLIESLEGKRAYPRIKPPYFPAVLGLYMCPTIVNNVETLCHVKHIVAMGGAEYAKLGTPNNTGTRIVCVSGDVVRPGYFEIEVGTVTMGQLHQRDGGRSKARAEAQSRHPRRQLGESFAGGRDLQAEGSAKSRSTTSRWISTRWPRPARWPAPAASS